jgi:hypothetical protein
VPLIQKPYTLSDLHALRGFTPTARPCRTVILKHQDFSVNLPSSD